MMQLMLKMKEVLMFIVMEIGYLYQSLIILILILQSVYSIYITILILNE